MLLPALAAITVLAAADNNVEWNGVSHLAWQDRRPLCPVNGETFEVRFQTWQDDLTQARVQVDDGAVTWVPASVATQRGPYDVWTAQVPATAASTSSYWIELTDGTDVDYFSISGALDLPPGDGGFPLNFNTLEHAPLGATPVTGGGVVFRVWAPNATSATIRGEFNGWANVNAMTKYGNDYIRYIPSALIGDKYKYYFNNSLWRSDPRARSLDASDNDNSEVRNPFSYSWIVEDFNTPSLQEIVVYQLHTGTFSGRGDPVGTPPFPGGHADVAARVAHLVDLGVNCVMLNPINEFPGEESAGYNPISAWSPEWTYGPPDDLKLLVDTLHQNGIAVLLDIVWNHFSVSGNYLWDFDGTQIYFDTPAVSTPWGDQADFDRTEVQDYFLDSAHHWFEEYKIDGFRMDATDFMNMPPQDGSGWNLMQRLNDLVDNRWANKIMIAEQLPDDAWVTRPTNDAGAGFDSQYNDDFTDRLREEILDAALGDPEMWKIRNIVNGNGQYLENRWVTNYVELHDEAWPTSGGQRLVKTIDTTFPHDDQFAVGRTRLAQGLVLTAPGVPAMLMGTEWQEDTPFGTGFNERIDWTKKTTYAGTYAYYRDLVTLRITNSALWADAFHQVAHQNESGNVISFRRANFVGEDLLVVANFSNTTYNGYRVGVPLAGDWNEILNSEATAYDRFGPENPGALSSQGIASDLYTQSIQIEIPARGLLVFRHTTGAVGVPTIEGAAPATRIEAVRPNPGIVDSRRTIDFALARAGLVKVQVVDATGRSVTTLLAEHREAGRHTISWDGRNQRGAAVAAGVYFVRLVPASGEPTSGKMIVLN
ncbi:MAG: hypothetical protein DHS20C21_01590 [Gemmatimonadota bacterium]|nr:MAG: hypothetical protein DHS20C21_01590 [Gemmatimonadota bacterium]